MRALDYEYDDDAPTQRIVRRATRAAADADTVTRWSGTMSVAPMVLSSASLPPEASEPARRPPRTGLRLLQLTMLLLVVNAGVIGVLHRYRGLRFAPAAEASRHPRDCTTRPRPLVTTSATQKLLNRIIFADECETQ